MRTYYENKIPYDLLTWMINYDQFIIIRLNQVIFHSMALFMQFTMLKFEGPFQDERIGLTINQKCLSNKNFYQGTLEVVVSIFLVRHVIELIIFYGQKKKMFKLQNPKLKMSICGKEIVLKNKLIMYFLVT